jgi:serine/threonine-protein kinase
MIPSSTPDEEARSFLQRRLALLFQLVFLLQLTLLAFPLAIFPLSPEYRLEHPWTTAVVTVVTTLVFGVLWRLLRSRWTPSLPWLARIDEVALSWLGLVYGLTLYLQSARASLLFGVFYWVLFVVFARALVVPSTGRRSAVVSALAVAPPMLAYAALGVTEPARMYGPPGASLAGSLLVCGCAVGLAAVGSRVIFGLRREVREARRLGQYTLLERIGEGGMGAVYRARHAMLRRPTAVKLLRPDRMTAELLARFEREVQLTAQLTHPNVVTVYDFGRSPAGVFYYAMELLDGIDLERLVARDGPLPPGRVVHVLRQVAEALDEAHALGLIHRDVKPSNVILCRRGRRGDVAKVVDFGLVLEVRRREAERQVVAGTPAFISPEAIRAPETVGPAADLYSLGALGWFLLVGRLPFDGPDVDAVLEQHLHASAAAPSTVLGRPLPGDLEDVLLRCLAKQPEARYASARVLRDVLAGLSCADEWTADAAAAWWDRFESERAARRDSRAAAPEPSRDTLAIDLRGRVPESAEVDGAVARTLAADRATTAPGTLGGSTLLAPIHTPPPPPER